KKVGSAISSGVEGAIEGAKKVVSKVKEGVRKVGEFIRRNGKRILVGAGIGATVGAGAGVLLGAGLLAGAGIGALAGGVVEGVMGFRRKEEIEKNRSEVVNYIQKEKISFDQIRKGVLRFREMVQNYWNGTIKPLETQLEEVKREIYLYYEKRAQISPFFLRELVKAKREVDYTTSLLKAQKWYYNYLVRQLERVEEKPTRYRIADLALVPLPKKGEGLPEEYLFLGKLVRVTEEELGKMNLFHQQLLIEEQEKRYIPRQGEFTLLITRFQFDKGGNRRPPLFKFYGSIAKGEIAERFDRGEPIEAEVAEHERRGRSKGVTLKYKGTLLHLPIPLKFNPNRPYSRGERVLVYPESYDYLLKNIRVREIPPEGNSIQLPLYFPPQFPLPSTRLRPLSYSGEGLVLKGGKRLYRCQFGEGGLEVVEVGEAPEKVTELQMEGLLFFPIRNRQEFQELSQLIPATHWIRVRQLLYREFQGLEAEENPLFRGAKELTERQLQLNHYQREIIQFRREGRRLLLKNPPLLLSGEWTTPPKSILFQTQQVPEIVVEDYGEFQEGTFEIRLGKSRHLSKIPEEGFGTLLLSTPPYPIYKQLEAFREFELGYLANPALKTILLHPDLKEPATHSLPTLEFRNPNLTENQRMLLQRGLEEREFFAIQGPPGTGKSTLIREMIYQTLKLNRESSIILVSQQNVAVDNVLEGLVEEGLQIPMLRIGHSEKTYPSLHHLLPDHQLKLYLSQLEEKYSTEQNPQLKLFRLQWLEWLRGEIAQKKGFLELDISFKELFLRRYQLIGATCVGLANHQLGLEFLQFDLAIIDEAGRASLGELLIPILKAKKVVLIGDHKQLPPTYDRRLYQLIEEDSELGEMDRRILEESYFETLYTQLPEGVKGMLKAQFRMPPPIGSLISYLFYQGKLENGRTDWEPVPIVWIDVRGKEESAGTSKFNREEVKVVKELIKLVDPADSMAVITPYAAQKGILRRELEEIRKGRLKVDTIDSFQGEEADIVIYSLVRSRGNLQFILDKRRLNVAISRTKKRLYIVGNRFFFETKGGRLFREIIQSAHIHRWPRSRKRRRRIFRKGER
ncbi:MAG: AAA domain-containing protein, partial [Campylobacterales bacterium]